MLIKIGSEMKIQLLAQSVVVFSCVFMSVGTTSGQMLTPIAPAEKAVEPATTSEAVASQSDQVVLTSALFSQQQELPVPAPVANTGPVKQQTPATTVAHTKPAMATPAITTKIGFRMSEWKTIHGDGTAATQQFVDTLEKIGCEVKQSDHGNHVDVSFRCANWTAFAMQTEDQTEQWQQWLKDNEFEMVIQNPAANTTMPTVKLRLQDWKSMHLHDPAQVESMKRTFEMLGCEVALADHGDHTDANVRCAEWVTIGLPTPKAAHIWQDWLKKSGFETEHEHVHGHNQPQSQARVGQQPTGSTKK